MDKILKRFLECNEAEAKELASKSQVLEIAALPPSPSSTYVCEFRVPHLERTPEGHVTLVDGPVLVKIHFPEDYLRSADPRLGMRVVRLLGPREFIHPNVREGVVCLGYRFAPGTRIVLLINEIWEIVSYQNFNVDENDALNPEACRLLRAHPDLLAELEPKPLVRRPGRVRVEVRS